MMTYPGWDKLDNKEKDLCGENNIKPEDYYAMKKYIQTEIAKNKAITEALLKEKSKEFKSIKDKFLTVYDFFVRINLV
jgi:hypothetical protein